MSFHLPELPYAYNALEPYCDEATVRLHHDVHHRAYVDGLNRSEEKLAEARDEGDFPLIRHWECELAFHGSGHLLHTLFWQNMRPGGSGSAQGSLVQRITKDFGSFTNFKQKFTEAALAVEGSGWALLVWSPYFSELEILQAENHQDLSQWGVIPLLAVDVWEHAYYLKYQNKRVNWVEAWWNLVNWEDVLKRYEDNAGLMNTGLTFSELVQLKQNIETLVAESTPTDPLLQVIEKDSSWKS